MLKLELQSAAVAIVFTAFAFTTRLGLTPLHSHFRLTPWSVFQDGSSVHATLDNCQRCATLNFTQKAKRPKRFIICEKLSDVE
jgi:hypothetical protein